MSRSIFKDFFYSKIKPICCKMNPNSKPKPNTNTNTNTNTNANANANTNLVMYLKYP